MSRIHSSSFTLSLFIGCKLQLIRHAPYLQSFLLRMRTVWAKKFMYIPRTFHVHSTYIPRTFHVHSTPRSFRPRFPVHLVYGSTKYSADDAVFEVARQGRASSIYGSSCSSVVAQLSERWRVLQAQRRD